MNMLVNSGCAKPLRKMRTMNVRISMCPASMFAKRRTESERIRIRFDMTSRQKMNTAMPPVTPAGMRLLR